MRRLARRSVTSRRNLLAAAVLCTLLFLFLHSGAAVDRLPASLSPSHYFACDAHRRNPHHIVPPGPLDPAYTKVLWAKLKDIFDEHVPSPPHLDQPRHKQEEGFPAKDKLDSFFNLTQAEADKTRAVHADVLAKLPAYPAQRFEGRGVVVLAGARYSEFAATSLGMLREARSRLPVELWARDASEEVPGWCAELAGEGIACRRLADHVDVGALKHPYQWKVFTLLFSRFRDVLFLDADDMPVRSPDDIFDSAAYRDTGAVLWPDYWKHSGSPWLPYIVGLTEGKSDMLMDDKSVESGQIVWDKERHWKSLLLAAYYNYHGPDFYYTLFNNGWAGWGDKDTFPTALRALKEPYHQVPNDILTLFVAGTLLGVGMVQSAPTAPTHAPPAAALKSDSAPAAARPSPVAAPAGAPLFLHSNIVKWSMRNFLCRPECAPMAGHRAIYHQADAKSPVHPHLTQGKRIFATEQLQALGVDPEPVMWRAVEHSACRSRTWRNETLCGAARAHMRSAFGFRFEEKKSRAAGAHWPDATVWGDGVCVVNP